jgi:hypothetical protein
VPGVVITLMKSEDGAIVELIKNPTDEVLGHYLDANLGWFYVRKDLNLGGRERLVYTAVVDPEVLKAELNDMVTEAGRPAAPFLGHPSHHGGGYGHGRLLREQVGAAGDTGQGGHRLDGRRGHLRRRRGGVRDELTSSFRTALAFSFWIAGVNMDRFDDFRWPHPEEFAGLMDGLTEVGGHSFHFKGLLPNQEGATWTTRSCRCTSGRRE